MSSPRIRLPLISHILPVVSIGQDLINRLTEPLSVLFHRLDLTLRSTTAARTMFLAVETYVDISPSLAWSVIADDSYSRHGSKDISLFH